jgi:hypothetical protein
MDNAPTSYAAGLEFKYRTWDRVSSTRLRLQIKLPSKKKSVSYNIC